MMVQAPLMMQEVELEFHCLVQVQEILALELELELVREPEQELH